MCMNARVNMDGEATKCTIFCKKCVKKLAVSSEMCYFVPKNEKTSIMQQLNAYFYSYYYFTLTR